MTEAAEIERIARELHSRYGARGFEAAEAILRVLNPGPDEKLAHALVHCDPEPLPHGLGAAYRARRRGSW